MAPGGVEAPRKWAVSYRRGADRIRTVRTLAGAERRLDTSDDGGETRSFCGPNKECPCGVDFYFCRPVSSPSRLRP
jgi:hypothetical protein